MPAPSLPSAASSASSASPLSSALSFTSSTSPTAPLLSPPRPPPPSSPSPPALPASASAPPLPFCCCSRHACLNMAVLGHIDSGKTTLVRALTEVKSTAALDKPPQSQQRGMTLELGFTAFQLPLQRPSPPSATAATQSATAGATNAFLAPRGQAPSKKQQRDDTTAEEEGADSEEKKRSMQLQVTKRETEASQENPQLLRCGCPCATLGESSGNTSTPIAGATAATPPHICRSVRHASSSSSSSSHPYSSSHSSSFNSSHALPSSSSSFSASASPSRPSSSSVAAASFPHADFFPPTAAHVCLVDCPGHASLLRTIIGGVHIVHGVLLVIDVTKGIQSQTAECIVVAELLTCELIVVLNKIDLLPSDSREDKIAIVSRKLRATFSQTAFGGDVHIVAVAARPGSEQDAACEAFPWGVEEVKRALRAMLLRKQSYPCSCCSCCPSAGLAVSPQDEGREKKRSETEEEDGKLGRATKTTRDKRATTLEGRGEGRDEEEEKGDEGEEDGREEDKDAQEEEGEEEEEAGQAPCSKQHQLEVSSLKAGAERQGGDAGGKTGEGGRDCGKGVRETETDSHVEESTARDREKEKEQQGESKLVRGAAAGEDATFRQHKSLRAKQKQRTPPRPKRQPTPQQESSPPPMKQPTPQQEPHCFVDCLWNAQRCGACICCNRRHTHCDRAECTSTKGNANRSSTSSSNSSCGGDASMSGVRSNCGGGGGDTFYMAFDHCFALKGKGTIFTGTVLAGHVRGGDLLAVLPANKTGSSSSLSSLRCGDNSGSRSGNSRSGGGSHRSISSSNSSRSSSGVIVGKVRSLQTFHRDVRVAVRGQRIAVGLVGVDAASLERGALCDPRNVPKRAIGGCAVVQKIRFFRPEIPSGGLFHCTIGHTTVMCAARFFGVFPSDQPSVKQLSSHCSSPFSSSNASEFAAVPSEGEENVVSSAVAPGRMTSSLSVGRVVPSNSRVSYGRPLCPSSSSSYSSSSSKTAAFVCRERRWPDAFDEAAVYRCLDRLEDYGDAQQLPRKTRMNENNKDLHRKRNGGTTIQISDNSNMHRNACKASVSSHTALTRTVTHLAPAYTSSPPDRTNKERYEDEPTEDSPVLHLAVLLFEKPVTVPAGCLFICSKLDMEPSTAACRLAFFGRLLLPLDAKDAATACQQSLSSPAFRCLSSSLLSRTIPKTLWLHPMLKRFKFLKRKKKLGTVERFLFSPPCRCLVEHLPCQSTCNVSTEASSSLLCSALPSSSNSPASGVHTSQGCSKECVTYSLIGKGLFKSPQHVNAFVGFCVSVLPPASTEGTFRAARRACSGAAELTAAVTHGTVHAAKWPTFSLQAAAPETSKGSEEEKQQRSTEYISYGASGCIGSSGMLGWIEKPFGNKGKFVVELSGPVSCAAVRRLLPHGDVARTENGGQHDSLFRVVLEYEKHLFDDTKKFSQQCAPLCGTPEIFKRRATVLSA